MGMGQGLKTGKGHGGGGFTWVLQTQLSGLYIKGIIPFPNLFFFTVCLHRFPLQPATWMCFLSHVL